MVSLRSNRESIAAALAALYIVVSVTMMPAPVVLLTALGVDVTGAGLCGRSSCGSTIALINHDREPSVIEQLWAGACGVEPVDALPIECADDQTPPERPETCPYSSLRVLAAMCTVAIERDSTSFTLPPDTLCGVVLAEALDAEGRVFDVPSPPPRA